MRTTSDLDSLLTLRLRSLRCEQRALLERVATHDRLLYQIILPAMTHPGPPPSSASQPPPSPTTGTPSSTPSSDLLKRAKDLGGLVVRAIRLANLIKNVWGFWTLVAPVLLLAAGTVWKLAAPWLQWVWRLAAGW